MFAEVHAAFRADHVAEGQPDTESAVAASRQPAEAEQLVVDLA